MPDHADSEVEGFDDYDVLNLDVLSLGWDDDVPGLDSRRAITDAARLLFKAGGLIGCDFSPSLPFPAGQCACLLYIGIDKLE